MKKTTISLIYLSILLIFFAFADISYAQQIRTTSVFPESSSQETEQTESKLYRSNRSTYPGPLTPSDSSKQLSEDQKDPKDIAEYNKLLPASKPFMEEEEEEEKEEEELSDFEKFITGELPSSISTEIKQFGYDLFEEPLSKLTPPQEVSVGPGYVLGPGDELKITIWGKVEYLWNVTVDRNGNISMPKIGVINVSGLTFKEMKDTLFKEISRYYTGFEMNVSISSLRAIRVYIVGNAQRPGAYTISSLSTLVSSLFEAGGPSKTGSMRDIQLKRNGENLVHFDMYDFLLKGDKTKDLRIQSEDVIFIPPVGPLAGIAGNIKKPAIYELNGETRLLQLIDMAGGLTSIAFKGRVQVQRIENHEFRTLFENDLLDMGNNEGKNFFIKDGDLVKVFPVTKSTNMVKLTGAVEKEGEYAITPGATKIKDVILKAGGVLYYSSNQAELTRLTVTQEGPVTEHFNIDISKALNADPEHNITLEKNDYLFIRSVAEWSAYKTVELKGEVKFPGVYIINNAETLSSLIERAGGYTNTAYLRGTVFTRERVREIQQKSLEQLAAKMERALFAESSSKLSTAISPEEIAAKEAEIQQKKELIETLYRIQATGRMTIRMARLDLLKGTEYDIVLEEGDNLFIPKKNSVVNVLGAVMSRGSFIYIGDHDYEDYINLAGGYTEYADESKIYVLKVDGTAMQLSTGFFNWGNSTSSEDAAGFETIQDIEPGDSIVVSEEFERIAWMREIKDMSQILYQIAVSAAVVIDLLEL